MLLKDHNVNGKVLAACDLNELRDAMQMAFGDWQLFKAWILAARTREQSTSTRYPYDNQISSLCLLTECWYGFDASSR